MVNPFPLSHHSNPQQAALHYEMQLQQARAAAMYPNHQLPPQQQQQSVGGYQQVSYPSLKREHTPNYGDSSTASNSSLSPLSSHLGTPVNGQSPSVYPNAHPQYPYQHNAYPSAPHYSSSQHLHFHHHQQQQQQQQNQQNHQNQMNGSYLGLAPPTGLMKSEVTPHHQPHPNDQYSHLGQGTPHHAGNKRAYDQMLVGDFVDDVRKKRVNPSYNEGEF